jgi:N-acetylglucosamine-6-phosphate deacetylase
MKLHLSVCILFYLLMFDISYAQLHIEGLLYSDEKPVSIIIQDGIILAVNRIAKLSEADKNLYVAPGLIDNQVNGYKGVSFTQDEGQDDLTEADVYKATQAIWGKGVTTYLATITTSSQRLLLKSFSTLAKVRNDNTLLGSIAGFHLEGPYISPVEGYRGAHTVKHIRNPVWDEFMELYKASGNSIKTVTVAPEIPGALEFIKMCSDLGIIIALGHHNASADIIDQAVENGARICTHIGNGCANNINRHINPLWPQLSNDKLMISIICDGFHLRPEEIRVFYKVKGTDKTILTSDVTMFAGMTPGFYKNEDGEDIELTPDGEVRYPAQNVLYGSASALNKGVGHIMKVTGCTLADAIQMASTNPAILYGLNDRGIIESGKRADLIVFTMDHSGMKIKKTYVKGKLVYQEVD